MQKASSRSLMILLVLVVMAITTTGAATLTVKHFNGDNGFPFIPANSSADVFVHFTNILSPGFKSTDNQSINGSVAVQAQNGSVAVGVAVAVDQQIQTSSS